MQSVFIYALCEPDSGEIRYVGKSSNPERRFVQHASAYASDAVRAWIESLRLDGKSPSMKVLSEVTLARANEAERRAIASLPADPLLNRLSLAKAATDVPARARLRAFLIRNGISCREAAEALHVKHPTVLLWITGPNRPETRSREAIAIWTGDEVSRDDWLRSDDPVVVNVSPFRPV